MVECDKSEMINGYIYFYKNGEIVAVYNPFIGFYACKEQKKEKAEVVVNGNCMICGKKLNCGRLFICKECESKTVIDDVINDLKIAKCVLASPVSLHMSMRIKIGQAITKAIELLNESEKGEVDCGTKTT